jgi:hypothetical protein
VPERPDTSDLAIDTFEIDDYLDAFPHRDSILASIEKEVF